MSNVPTNLIPTRITGLPEYTGTSTLGYLPYVLEGRTYKVQFSNIAAVGAVPSSRVIGTGNGLEGGGDLSQDRVISIIPHGVGYSQLDFTGVIAGTYGAADTIPVITVDATGRVTTVVDTPISTANYVPSSRTVTAGPGLTGGGQLNNNITIALNPSNATPLSLGVASAGVGAQAARDDHVHPAVNLTNTSETQGVLPLGRGGTGIALSPVVGAVIYASGSSLDQTTAGNAGQVLMSAGGLGAPYWSTVTGTGTVSSVNVSGGTTGLTTTGGPVTTVGTITIGGTLNVANGGTGATTASGARTNLGATTVGGNFFTLTNPSAITFPQINADNSVSALDAATFRTAIGAGAGSVTSVDASGGTTGLTFTGGPITSSGTLTLGGTLGVANGGTGAATLTSNALLKGNGTSAISASSITDNGTLVTIAEPVRLSTPNGSYAAWTTSGINLIQSAATFTDTTSTGTVANIYMNSFGAQTLAATNTITVSNLFGTYFNAPIAGTNVTATRYALGADNFLCNGTVISAALTVTNGSVLLGNTTASQTLQLGYGTTASGSTKTVNIGTGGASGSTTAITLGSSTSGATQSTTINGTVTLAPIGSSAAAWTTNGIGLVQSAATFTDTTSTGTVAAVRMNNFAAQTMAASNSTTVTRLFGAYFNDPAAGTNVTATNIHAIGADSIYSSGSAFISATLQNNGSCFISNTTSTVNANVAVGATASGSTKTVNIGTGGASGSTTNITLGSSTSGATQTTTVNGQVTLAPIGGSAAAWTTSGIALKQSAATWTDTSSTGTVAAVRMNNFATQTLAASNAMTVTDLYGVYFTAPTLGANVTLGNGIWAVGCDSLFVNSGVTFGTATGGLSLGSSQTTGNFTVGGTSGTGTITLGRSTDTQTTNIQAGVTASGKTKTVNIGTGGASGSTTNITIGSSTSGATSTITMNGGVKPLTAAVTSSATITPTADTTNQYNVTALAVGGTFAAPSGTPVDGQKLMIRIKDNGTAQTLAWNAIYRVIGTTLPTTTTANKTIYVGCIYNSADSKWDVVAVSTEA